MAKLLKYAVCIDAVSSKVWKALTDHSLIPKWSFFLYATPITSSGNFKPGGQVYFEDGEGKLVKMDVTAFDVEERLHLNHTGNMKRRYSPGREHYKLWVSALSDNATILKVEVDIPQKKEEFFDNAWPMALNELKKIAEGRRTKC